MYSTMSSARSLSQISKNLCSKRLFSSRPLGEPHANAPRVETISHAPQTSKLTQLQNGVKVVSVNDPLQKGVSVGLFVRSGSRNENTETHGASYFLKRMGFQSTNTRTSLRLAREIENSGATYRVSTSREHMMYATETTPNQLSEAVNILSDVSNPALLDWEVRDEVPVIENEFHKLEQDARTVVFELLHQVGYRNNGLGNALLPAVYNIHNLDSDVLAKFVSDNYTADKFTLVATGLVNHDSFVKSVQESFSFNNRSSPSSHTEQKVENRENKNNTNNVNSYVGGDVRLPADGDTHFALAFEGLPYGHKDQHVLSVIQFLLGGGSNSMYAIGNGSTSQLFRTIDAKNEWAKEVSAFNVNYSDSGLFGLYVIARRGNTKKLTDNLMKGVKSVFDSLNESSLTGAKNRYKLDLYTNNEGRSSQMEFVAQQALLSGKLESLENLSKRLDTVTVNDVKRVLQSVLSKKPTLVAVGDVENIPDATSFVSKLK